VRRFTLITIICLVVLLAGAAVASFAELLPLPIDDNFTIPLAAGLAMALVLAWS